MPITIALFYLGHGDVECCVTCSANFGRDADTIATMCGALAGALQGLDGIKSEWVSKAKKLAAVNQEELAENLVRAALAKSATEQKALQLLDRIA